MRFHLHPVGSGRAGPGRQCRAAAHAERHRVAAARRRRRDGSRRKHLSRLRRGEKDAAGRAERDRAARRHHGALGDSPRAAQVHRGSGPGGSVSRRIKSARIRSRRPPLPGISRPAMGEAAWPAAVAVATGLLTCLTTRALIPILAHREILDRPNERSSHRVPTPRGGGIAVIGSILLAWIVLARTGIGAVRRLRDRPRRRLAGGGFMARRSARPLAGRAAAGAGRRRGDRHLCPARAAGRFPTSPRSASSGSGGSICSTSWTGSTGWPAARLRRSAPVCCCSRASEPVPIPRCGRSLPR